METPQQREDRKDMYISKVLSMSMGADHDEVIREASDKFEETNPIK